MVAIAHSLLSVSLAASAFFIGAVAQSSTVPTHPSPSSTPPPINSDPCARLAQLDEQAIRWKDVADCYLNIPFHAENAKTTIDSLTTLYKDFYVFTDSALTPDLARPFSSPPVDILASLQQIGQRQYQREHDFHSDLFVAISALNDAHATYRVDCFVSYFFMQPIALYTSVDNGRQTVRVFRDTTKNTNYRECEVLSIDGQNPLTHIQAWADINLAYSKDPGARLNEALASGVYSPITKEWMLDTGSFASRPNLPLRDSITYRLRCPNNPQQITFTAPWGVAQTQKYVPFQDSASFYHRCSTAYRDTLQKTPKQSNGNQEMGTDAFEDLRERQLNLPHEFDQHVRRTLHRRQDPTPNPSVPPDAPPPTLPGLPGAPLVFTTENFAFYQLATQPHVGVMVVPTMRANLKDGEPEQVLEVLASMAANGVTNIILDLRTNGGGYVQFASDLVTAFFPGTDVSQVTQILDLRLSDYVKTLADADFFNKTVNSNYEATTYVVAQTLEEATAAVFNTPVTIVRNDRSSQYTVRMYYDVRVFQNVPQYPWTNDATKIKVLTDGRCGSACGLTTDILVNRYGVEAYAVGGYDGQQLSMFSFAGAAVQGIEDVLGKYAELGLQAPMKSIPLAGSYNFGYTEVYSNPNDTIPLEYNPARHPAKYRWNYNQQWANHPDQLWQAIALDAWKA